MPIDLSAMLDQLEEWIESQVPPNLHDLPGKMLETVERVSNELSEFRKWTPKSENIPNRSQLIRLTCMARRRSQSPSLPSVRRSRLPSCRRLPHRQRCPGRVTARELLLAATPTPSEVVLLLP